MELYPLKFLPRYVEKMWGGRKINTVLDKPLPAGKCIGESWEIFDFPPGVIDQSTDWVSSEIANGPLAGHTLHWAITEFAGALMGDAAPIGRGGQFPVLIKFLDAREDLSVQVHPDQKYAAAHAGANLKTEAWYIIQSDAHSRLFKGIPEGTTPGQFRKALESGTVEKLLTSIEVKAGECYYLPSGTVHALGAGILAAEVQTPSDTTYRVFDFNRVDPSTGKLRDLHIEQAMECIDFAPSMLAPPRSDAGKGMPATPLVSSPFFTMTRMQYPAATNQPLPARRPRVWMMLEGHAQIQCAGLQEPTAIVRGDTVLLPAAMSDAVMTLKTHCTWLEITFPTGG